ncbi:MAG: hypothetical protein WBI07_02615, partial [Mobilitalea sp.]
AVNGEPFLNRTQASANTALTNYVATETRNVEVSGRIYGLTLYDVSDYPDWKKAFRIPDSQGLKKDSEKYSDGTASGTYSSGRYYTYTVGTGDQYGNDTGRSTKYTFPLVDGSHPYYRNTGILKTGYLVRFSLETTGSMFADSARISIEPSFYHVDADGGNRTEVDLYYTEEIDRKSRHLVKVGGALDAANLKYCETGDAGLGIPLAEMIRTAGLRGVTYSSFLCQRAPMFTFAEIRLHAGFRTYVNDAYLAEVKSYGSYPDLEAGGITEGSIRKRMQRWYGQYYIPNEVHAVRSGYDVMDYADRYGIDYDEDFWLKDGYLIVNFRIETVGEDGKRRLSYINAPNYLENGNCSMWLTENPVSTKTSYQGPEFRFYAGDFVIYYMNRRMSEDYSVGAIY